MSDLLKQVEQSIGSRNLLKRGQKILIAVSGGLDSMVLLQVLHELSRKHSWRLTVAHLNHQLRGRSSDADERLVLRTAKKLGLPVISERADVRTAAHAGKVSVEMAARKVRHEFLARTAVRLRVRTVAIAHHADDQLELFLLRLLRGGGNEGLAGMKWCNASSANPDVELIRPLLDQPKATLSAYARRNKIAFREDASNASLDIQRNRIRHELLPLLRRHYQPALDRAFGRVMDIAGAEAELAGRLALEWLNGKGKRSQPFEKLPVAVQRRCLQWQLQRRKIPVDYDLVEYLRTRPGSPIKVSAELAVILKDRGILDFRATKPTAGPNPVQCEVDLHGNAGKKVFGKVKILWRKISGRPGTRPGRRVGREVFDADKVGSRIRLRHWQPGDRFQPSGMLAAVKLQDLFTNQKIPREQRHGLVVAATGSGELFWVENLRIAEPFKLSSQTIRRLQWQWKRL